MPRRAAVFVVFAGTLVVVAGIGLLLVPALVDQVEALVAQLPDLLDNLAHGRGPLGFLEDRFHIVERAKDALEHRGAGSLLGFTGPLFSAIAGVVRTVIGALISWASAGFTAAAVFAAFLLIYQQVIENHLLVPVVYGRTVELDAL